MNTRCVFLSDEMLDQKEVCLSFCVKKNGIKRKEVFITTMEVFGDNEVVEKIGISYGSRETIFTNVLSMHQNLPRNNSIAD